MGDRTAAVAIVLCVEGGSLEEDITKLFQTKRRCLKILKAEVNHKRFVLLLNVFDSLMVVPTNDFVLGGAAHLYTCHSPHRRSRR